MLGTTEGGKDLNDESNKKLSPLIPAVKVLNAWKCYDSKISVIRNLNMTVPSGSIYALLGASGCGKTTILSCIVGTRRLDKGLVSVFGQIPGTPESGIPGRTVGFMPQEVALYGTLTIGETFKYFGKLYGLSDSELGSKMESMFTFLDLPERWRLVGSLSGGQRKRTSLGVSLMHEPPLLILDEPTVGVDPLLRERIWDYLRELVARKGTTVIVTTHYIEEATNAHIVGVMRNGRLLEEASPSLLLQQHGTNRLEEVVLKLFKVNSSLENNEDGTPELPIDLKINQGSEDPLKFNYFGILGGLAKNLGNFLNKFSSRNGNAEVKQIEGVCAMDAQESVDCLRFQSISHPSESFLGNDHPDVETLQFSNSNGVDFKLGKRPGINLMDKLKRVMAISYKNLCTVVRQKVVFAILLILTPMNLYMVDVSFGGDPKGLTFGVVNPETNYSICGTFLPPMNNIDGSLETLSCQFLNQLPTETLALLPKSSNDEALQDVVSGRSVGFMEFPQNYSHHSVARVAEGSFASNETLVGSTVSIRMDASNAISALLVQRTLLLGFQRYARNTLAENDEVSKKADLPLKFSAVYGAVDSSSGIGRSLVAGVLILFVFYVPLMPTAFGCISDHKNGTFERSRIAGATKGEVMVGALIVHLLFVGLVTGSGFILLIYGLQIEILGSTSLCFTLCILCGICGGLWGIANSEIVPEEMEALLIGMTGFALSILFCGVGWPIEMFPKWISFVSKFTPYTWAITSLRSVFTRGWGIGHPKVWPGFAILCIWIGVFCIMTILLARRRHH